MASPGLDAESPRSGIFRCGGLPNPRKGANDKGLKVNGVSYSHEQANQSGWTIVF
jgi:hypothetical protein